MEKYISCGKFNKYYYFILLTFLFDLINDSLYGFNYMDIFEEFKIINTKTQQKLSWHHIIHQIFNYIATYIFAYFFNKYENYSSQTGTLETINDSNKDSLKIELIHNDFEYLEQNNHNFLICLLIIIIWVFAELFIDIYIYALKDLDFWMIELIIITYLNAYMFKIQIFKHQKFAIWFNIFPCLLKSITIILSLFDDNDKLPILYNINKVFIPIGIIIYLILITLRSYAFSKIKWFMDLKYISPSKLLIYLGLIGTIICTLICIVSTFVECYDNIKHIEITDYICRIPYNEQNIKKAQTTSNKKYLDSFIIYFKELTGKNNDDNYSSIEILYEIIIILSGMVTFFFQKYFSILVIKYLTPVHLIFSFPIFNFFQKLVLVIFNLCRGRLEVQSSIKFILHKFYLDIFGDCLSFFGFLVYLEIIELNCCTFSYNIKKNITRRSFDESYGIQENKNKISNKKNKNEDDENEEEQEESDDDELTLN